MYFLRANDERFERASPDRFTNMGEDAADERLDGPSDLGHGNG